MQITIDLPVRATTDTAMAALADDDFVQFTERRSDIPVVDSAITSSPEGDVTIAVRRAVPSSLIPQQARPFVGGSLEIRQVEAWSRPLEGASGARYGTVAAELVGAPVQMQGNVSLIPDGDGACTLRYDLKITAMVPLFSSKVEAAAAKTVSASAEFLNESLEAWLAGER